jgi:hypothetical protein
VTLILAENAEYPLFVIRRVRHTGFLYLSCRASLKNGQNSEGMNMESKTRSIM